MGRNFFLCFAFCLFLILAIRIDCVEEVGFFRSLASLPFESDDVIAMFDNVSAAVESEECKGKCKTPLLFWMLRAVEPCEKLLKADCPLGLVCCSSYEQSSMMMTKGKSSFLEQQQPGHESGFFIPPEDIVLIREYHKNKTKIKKLEYNNTKQ